MPLVFVRPAPGSSELVRNPLDPSRRIAPDGEMLTDCTDLRRLEIAGDVTITATPPAPKAAGKKGE